MTKFKVGDVIRLKEPGLQSEDNGRDLLYDKAYVVREMHTDESGDFFLSGCGNTIFCEWAWDLIGTYPLSRLEIAVYGLKE